MIAYGLRSIFHLVHLCERENNGGCAQICNKVGDKVKCTCRTEFELSEDGMTCEEGKN